MNHSEIIPSLKIGSETFSNNSIQLDLKLKDFWAWNQSNLIENRTRGILAEFIVKQALEIESEARVEWDNYDLISNTGKRIEVKSAAYIQSWKQRKFSNISFSIARSKGTKDHPDYDGKYRRWADYYIFCLLAHKDQETIDPLKLEQWRFYVLETAVINDKIPNQDSISLKPLLKLAPVEFTYDMIKGVVDGE